MRNMMPAMVAALVAAYGGMSLACDTCGCSSGESRVEQNKKDVSTTEVKQAIAAGDVTVLDARSGTPSGGVIPGAKVVGTAPTADDVAKMVPSKDALVITYCSGRSCGASKTLGAHLRKLGYTNVKEYWDGAKGWADAGEKLETKTNG